MNWVYLQSENQPLPPASTADMEGLVALGGTLTHQRLEEAYSKGIYPWYNEDDPVMWWSPDPRMVLFPEKLHVPKSMRPFINRRAFSVTVNRAFEQVMLNCAQASRPDQEGTWINKEMLDAYTSWHKEGRVHSFEAWQDGEIVGGLYGVSIGKVFFGESMFSLVPNASKYAFIKAVKFLQAQGVELIDCQMETNHLKRFGAELIPREEFISRVNSAKDKTDITIPRRAI